MGVIIYETRVDRCATAERHFRTVEKQMLEGFDGREKGYIAEVKGWMLIIECGDEKHKIDLKQTCNWNVKKFEDIDMAVIQFDFLGKKHEMIFAVPVIIDSNKIGFIGIRKVK